MRRFVRRIQPNSPDHASPRPELLDLTIATATLLLLDQRSAAMRPNTIKRWQVAANNAKRSGPLAGKPIRALTTKDFTSYTTARLASGAARSSLQGELIILSVAARLARPDLIVPIIARRDEELRQPIALTEQQINRLREETNRYPDLRCAFELGLQGMRIGEILSLAWASVLDENGRLTGECRITQSKTKAGRRTIPLNQHSIAALEHRRTRYLDPPRPHSPIFGKLSNPNEPRPDLDKTWTAARKRAGLENVRFHDLRHTAITRLCEAGTPDWTIRAIVGHVDEAMLAHYSHPRKEAMRNAVAAVEQAAHREAQ